MSMTPNNSKLPMLQNAWHNLLLPFVAVQFLPAFTWPITQVYYIALGLALLTLFGLGMFLGRISRQNLWLFGIKTVMAGVLSILISYLLRGVKY